MWVVASQIVGGFLYATLFEWIAHKHILHGLGKKKGSFWHFHWTHHHRCRKSDNYDPLYDGESTHKTKYDGLKEKASVWVLAALHLPLLGTPLTPFALTVVFMSGYYLWSHSYSHRNVEWGKKWMPHHYDHHMGKNQDLNFCVTFPVWDYVFGTREKNKE